MSEKIKREDGTEVELFTIEELENSKVEVEQKVRAEEKEKLNPVVEEIKDLRKKLQEAHAKIDNSGGNDVENTVKSLLEKERQTEVEVNKEKARQLFFEKNKEFHPDNDLAGIKFKKIQSELDGLKDSGFKSVEDFMNLLNKANKLATDKVTPPENIRVNASDPVSSSIPNASGSSQLTSAEQQLIKQAGWTEERFVALKAKQPDYVRNLLRSAGL